jgi:hypothetical protein
VWFNAPEMAFVTTARLRDATKWDQIVAELGLDGLVRYGLRHLALTWMADAGVEPHLLQRVAGHQDPAVTSGYLHPDVRAVQEAEATFSLVVPHWSPEPQPGRGAGRRHGGMKEALTCRYRIRADWSG